MIINHWGPLFTRLYGHHFPRSYLCIDTEYTGGNAEKDLIVEIGHCLVEDQHPVDQLGVILDWSKCPEIVPNDWVRKALKRIELRMATAGRTWHVTWDVMTKEGIHPLKALNFYYDLFAKVKQRGLFFAAHNGFSADERMLIGHFEGILQKPFRFGENQLFDTGAIAKATRCELSTDPVVKSKRHLWLPEPGDTLESYFRRVSHAQIKGILWNMTNVLQEYHLDEKYSLDMEKSHSAEFDAYTVHLLMEEFRSRITHSNGKDALDAAGLAQIAGEELAKHQERADYAAAEVQRRENEFERRQGEEHRGPRHPVRRRGQRVV